MNFSLSYRILIYLVCLASLATFAQVSSTDGQQAIRVEKITVQSGSQKLDRIYTPLNLRGNLPINPSNRYFLGGIGESTLYALDLNSGEEKKITVPHKFNYAIFDKNGRRVLIFEFRSTKATVVDLEQGRAISTINSNEKISQFNFSSDGERVATSREEVKILRKGKSLVGLWNASDGKLIARIDGCAKYDKAPIFSSNSRFLLLDCEKVKGKPTKVIDAKTGNEIASLWKKQRLGSYEFVSDFTPESVFSPDEKTIASIVRFSGIRLWDIASGNVKREFKASQGDVMWITFTNDGRSFATNGRSPVIRLWDTETGDHRQTFTSEITKAPSFMLQVEISPDGTTLAGVDNWGRITVWELETGKVRFTVNENATKEEMSVTAFYGLEGRVLFVYMDKTIKVVDAQSGKIAAEVPDPTGLYYFSEDGKRFFTQESDGIAVWSVN